MLTGILTKPANINKGQDNIMTLDRDALLADVIANKDSYFHQLGRWSQVLITYKSSQGEQLNHLEFDPTTGAFPTANFNPSSRARNIWLVQTVMVRDLDEGEIIYYRDELDTAHFDITLDQIAPTLQTVSIESDNVNPAIANIGDTVSLTFTGSEPLANVSASILGQLASISGSGTNWTASYTLVGGESSGLASFTIDFEDVNSNQGVQVTSTTDASSVTVQYVVPTLDIVTIYSDNANPATAITGDTVSLDFTASDLIANISVSILGNNVTASSLGGEQYRAQYTVQAGDSNGLVNFSIDYKDLYNNTAPTVTTTTDASSVTISNDKPELAIVNIASNNSRNIEYADVGDTIFLVVRADEQNITFNSTTIIGNPVTMVYQGPVGSQYQWQAQYIVQGVDAEGLVPFTIDFENNLGVDGDQVTSTTTGNTVEIINQVFPSFLNLQSNNTDNTLSEPGNTTTVTMTTPSPVANVEFRLFNTVKTATNTSGNTWEANYSHTELQRNNVDGYLYNSVLINYDKIIPWSSVNDTISTTDGSSVYVNNIPIPQTVTYSSNNQYNSNYIQVGDTITISLVTSENVTQPITSFYGNSGVVSGSGTSWTIEYVIQEGNTPGNISWSLELVDLYGTSSGNILMSSPIIITDLVPLQSLSGTKVVSTSDTFYVSNLETRRSYHVPTGQSAGDLILPNFTRDLSASGDSSLRILGASSNSSMMIGNGWVTVPIDPQIIGTAWKDQIPTAVDDNRILLLNNSQGVYSSDFGNSWSSVFNLPIIQPYVDVVWGNSMWISVSSSGTVIKSTNGISWSISANLTSSSITSIRYINNQFVIISSDKVWTSTNGISWTERTIPFNTWIGIEYGNGTYVAVANGSYLPGRSQCIATSTDLVTWTSITVPFDTSFRSIAYNINNSVFLITGTTTNSAEATCVIGSFL